jgi:hypothetical protein
MRTFQEFVSEASKIYPSSVNQDAVREKEKNDRRTARDDMYSPPMRTHASAPAPGGPEPRRTPESRAAIKRRENLPPETKLRNIENDIARQAELKKQALHNISTGNTSSSTATVGKSLEQMKAELRRKRIETFGPNNPMKHKDEPEEYAHELPQQIPARKPPSSTPRPAPAAPRKVNSNRTPPAAPIKKG